MRILDHLERVSHRPLARRILRYARAPLTLIPKGAVVRVFTGPNRGKKWIVGAGNHVCWLGLYERAECHAFLEHVGAGMTVWDIGAHAGYYTLAAAEAVGAKGRVHAFEPNPVNVAYLEKHLKLNRLSQVQTHAAALSTTAGNARFAGTSSTYAGRIDEAGLLSVRLTTCDLEAAAHGHPDVIKIDVEGHEVDVLHGAAQVLRGARPLVFLSTHSRKDARTCHGILGQEGYTLRRLREHVILAKPRLNE